NFSLVYHVLLRPLVLPDLDHLVLVQEKSARDPLFESALAPRTWLDFREETRSYVGLGACTDWNVNLTGIDTGEQVLAAQVSPEFFSVLGEHAALGRPFAPDEVKGQHDRVAVLADGLWRRRFGSDANVVGRTIQLDGETYTIVGVMPK